MEKIEQNFYKYTVTHYEEVDGAPELKTSSGLTFGQNFNEVCAKITDYFKEDVIEDIKIEFASDCDMLEDYEIAELFSKNNGTNNTNNIANEIKTGLNEAIEYEKGNLDLKATKISTPN